MTDGGLQWRNNASFADENSTDNVNYNGNQYGDYTGIAALNRQVHPLWTDSRNFFPNADTQAPTRLPGQRDRGRHELFCSGRDIRSFRKFDKCPRRRCRMVGTRRMGNECYQRHIFGVPEYLGLFRGQQPAFSELNIYYLPGYDGRERHDVLLLRARHE